MENFKIDYDFLGTPGRVYNDEELREKIFYAQIGCDTSRSQVLMSMTKFANALIMEHFSGCSIDDAMAIGLASMNESIDAYDVDHGVIFATYSAQRMCWAISAFVTKDFTVTTPNGFIDLKRKVNKVKDVYFNEHECYPSMEYLIEKTGSTRVRLSAIDKHDVRCTSTDVLTLPPGSYDPFTDEIQRKEAIRDLLGFMKDTADKDTAELINHRYGIGYEEPKTLKELSELYGTTGENLRVKIEKELKRLRNHANEMGITLYDITKRG